MSEYILAIKNFIITDNHTIITKLAILQLIQRSLI